MGINKIKYPSNIGRHPIFQAGISQGGCNLFGTLFSYPYIISAMTIFYFYFIFTYYYDYDDDDYYYYFCP